MLRPVIRGARWYQHVAHSSNSAASPCSFARTFTAIAPRSINYGGPNDKVKFYEQDTLRSTKRRKIDPEAEDNAEREEVARELSQLDRDLEAMKEDPFGPNSSFIQSLPEDERAIALEALRKQEANDGKDEPVTFDDVFDEELDQMLKEEFEGLALEEENWMRKKKGKPEKEAERQPYQLALEESEHSNYIDRFNRSLERYAINESNDKASHELWKWYRGCRQIVPRFVNAIPEEAMTLLWSSQTSHAARIQVLAEDVLSAGRSLPTGHILSYIKSLHQLGKTKAALDQWEIHQAGLSQQKEDLEAYWKLGVQLFTAEGNPQRAQDIALAFMTNANSQQARVLIPIITAWGRQSGREAEFKLWALYLQLKAMLRHEMTMKDYDQISIGLLKGGKLNLAIAVFKDMMVTGKDSANDSTTLYTAALGLAGNLQASAVSEKEVNRVSLSTLTVLPRRYENRFFYASWLKKLIGMGEVDSAASVIELMYERGVRPDPKHLNGLIAGWLREGSAPARDRAEHLGWSMIKQRIDRDSQADETELAPPGTRRPGARIPQFMQRPMPAATIETFSILLLHYTRRGEDEAIEHLVNSLTRTRIQPNSYFMNHLLYAELRKQNINALWNKFRALSSSVQPDLETYACLWDCGKVQYDRSRTAYLSDFPTARALYAEMITWFFKLSTRAQTTTQEDFSKDLYDQIIRCFCLSKDLPGTLVALSSLRLTFGFHPDEATARLIILSIARHAAVPSDTPKRRLRRLSSTPQSKANIAYVQRLVELLSDRKSAALEPRGLTIGSLDPHEKETHQLEIMTDLLRIVMGQVNARTNQAPDPDRVEEQLCSVAVEMGVPGIYLGPKLGDENSGLISMR
ncbi:pentatricopeptide repeat protein [Aspergillus mulundensis]|uniref:Pentatricopeptide repeat protein n=1 Tax=Aspergillus mulundensis TaxID=1810919 RepID=A0A3D8S637_9EURO|nr:hypothetical protein DSM5745_05334 [Aspergillus mulundensis]RDW81777.1 hypothetical protein DSM5745_05334 [Aspergillus mulundensis]